jgi:transcription-repair coupling factor (superfamily II helicase)
MTAVLPHAAATDLVRQLPIALKDYPGFLEAVGALAAGHPASFDGVWGSACALLAAALAEHASGPLVVVLPTEREADDTAADLELFTGHEPRFFASWETAPDERLVHDETFGERLRTLKELLAYTKQPAKDEGQRTKDEVRQSAAKSSGLARFMKARSAPEDTSTTSETPSTTQESDLSSLVLRPSSFLLVTSIPALLQPSPRKDSIAAATRILKKGQRIDVEELLRWLVERGFHATSAVELPGEFSHRGGIIDIFATDWLLPVRIELFDDEIESLRSFEVATQRSHATLDEIEITVLGAGTPAEESGYLTDYLPPAS